MTSLTNGNDQLARVARLAAELETVDAEIAAAETLLEKLRHVRREMVEHTLPVEVDLLEWDEALMPIDDEGNVVELRLPTGQTLRVAEAFYPHLYAAKNPRRAEQLQWIEANATKALLSLDVEVSFTSGEGAKARAALAALENAIPGHTITKTKSIHFQTFQKFCRDRLALGKDLPEILGVFHRRVAEIVPPLAPVEPGPADAPRYGIPKLTAEGYDL
jgi:hypothetical protein